MNELQIFEREDFGAVRVVEIDNDPWFVAKDVSEALGYQWNGAARIAHVPDEWKGVTSVVTPYGTQEVLTISEQGLYFFLGRSDKPAALPYQKWIAGEVMPTIRKTGAYSLTPKTYPEALRALAAEVELREAVEQQKVLAEAQRDEAIRTKAEIGSRREATSMATASAAVRKAAGQKDMQSGSVSFSPPCPQGAFVYTCTSTSTAYWLRLFPAACACAASLAWIAGSSRNVNFPEYGLFGSLPTLWQCAR